MHRSANPSSASQQHHVVGVVSTVMIHCSLYVLIRLVVAIAIANWWWWWWWWWFWCGSRWYAWCLYQQELGLLNHNDDWMMGWMLIVVVVMAVLVVWWSIGSVHRCILNQTVCVAVRFKLLQQVLLGWLQWLHCMLLVLAVGMWRHAHDYIAAVSNTNEVT
jgi:hypothetical protein